MNARDAGAGRGVLVDDGVPPVTGGGDVSIARFVGLDAEARFLLDCGSEAPPVVSLSCVALTEADAGAQVVVAFEGASRRPIIVGLLRERAQAAVTRAAVDGERVVIKAEREIELRCGDASIVLTRAGKVLIRGTYVLSRSRGANRIKGAFVDIN
jgi:hypothetical protein